MVIKWTQIKSSRMCIHDIFLRFFRNLNSCVPIMLLDVQFWYGKKQSTRQRAVFTWRIDCLKPPGVIGTSISSRYFMCSDVKRVVGIKKAFNFFQYYAILEKLNKYCSQFSGKKSSTQSTCWKSFSASLNFPIAR